MELYIDTKLQEESIIEESENFSDLQSDEQSDKDHEKSRASSSLVKNIKGAI